MFKWLSKKKEDNKSVAIEDTVPPEYSNFVKIAIGIFEELDRTASEAEVYYAFCAGGIDPANAKKLVVFLPIAFCRSFLPTVKFRDDYSECGSLIKGFNKRKFSTTTAYTIALEEVQNFIAGKPGGEIILKIGGRSAEFNVINNLLLQSGKMEEIELTSMIVNWNFII